MKIIDCMFHVFESLFNGEHSVFGTCVGYKRDVEKNSTKIVSKYDQEIPQLQTADKPMTPATSSPFPIKMIANPEWT